MHIQKNLSKKTKNWFSVGNESDCRSRGRKFNPGPVQSDHEIISTILLASAGPSTDSRRIVVSDKRKYVPEVLSNRLVKLAQETVCLGELTIST